MTRTILLAGLVALCTAACAAGSTDGGGGLFAEDTLLSVDIELGEDDWDTLRYQGRDIARAYQGCFDFAGYDFMSATVTIDGAAVSDVAVRKKGFIGSLSASRPSLKLDYGRRPDDLDRTFRGDRRITLNNNRQDLSGLRQCMAYAVFTAAGVHAPRCNFARVRVRGEDLGVYTHVEAIKKPFLARSFGDDSGHLYEGQVADFSPQLLAGFEQKTHKGMPEQTALKAVIDALDAPDAELQDALSAVIDLDAYFTFWATEVLVGQSDGYSGNQNNFYVYAHPEDGRLHFIPWGADAAFESTHVEFGSDIPPALFAGSELSKRLYGIPAMRGRYEATLRRLLEEVWDGEALLGEVDRLATLTSPSDDAVDRLRAFIEGRAAAVEAALDGGPQAWPGEPRTSAVTCTEPPATEGRFEVVWQEDPMGYLPASGLDLTLPLGGLPVEFEQTFARAGPIEGDGVRAPELGVGLVGTDVRTGRQLYVGLHLPAADYGEGEVRLHGWERYGIVMELDDSFPDGLRRAGAIGSGSIHFERAGDAPGEPVVGHFHGLLATDPGAVDDWRP